jgi:hypothetical protein
VIWTYTDDGRREPFDPTRLRFLGCVLCGDPQVTTVGMFRPATDEMRLAVLLVRHRPPAEGMEGGLAYGVCSDCADDPDVCERVERAIFAASKRTVQ